MPNLIFVFLNNLGAFFIKLISKDMNHKRFEQNVDAILAHCKKTLTAKADDYASKGDRFHNFQRCSDVTRMPMVKTLFFMHTKHWVRYFDWANGNSDPRNMEEVDEVIGDLINYAIIARAMYEEKFRPTFEQEDARENSQESILRPDPSSASTRRAYEAQAGV